MRRTLFALTALVASAVIGGLLLEAGVLLLFGEQAKFPRRVVGAPFGLRINEPNAVYRHKSADVTVWFRINSQGMRADREFAREKPPGVKRIVSLGDSFTMGYEVANEETFSSLLERDLRAKGLNVEVINAGVSGYSNAEECLYLERELLSYSPDLVIVSFYANDLDDNVRSGLFGLEHGVLVPTAQSYVPGGGLGDFLNTNPVFNFLSGYSNAFSLIKETATLALRKRMVAENVGEAGAEAQAFEGKLAAAIFERISGTTRAKGIPLVIQSIPMFDDEKSELIDVFPLQEFDVRRPGLYYLSAKAALDPYVSKELLYWKRSHRHWTPLAHRLDAEALADLIVNQRLLD
jgi:lysophospholipase L1-like esterase